MKLRSSSSLIASETSFLSFWGYSLKVYSATLLLAPVICIFLMKCTVSEFALAYALLVALGFIFSVLAFIVFFLWYV